MGRIAGGCLPYNCLCGVASKCRLVLAEGIRSVRVMDKVTVTITVTITVTVTVNVNVSVQW